MCRVMPVLNRRQMKSNSHGMLRARGGHKFVICTESNIGYTWEHGKGTPAEAIKRTMNNGMVGDWIQTHRQRAAQNQIYQACHA